MKMSEQSKKAAARKRTSTKVEKKTQDNKLGLAKRPSTEKKPKKVTQVPPEETSTDDQRPSKKRINFRSKQKDLGILERCQPQISSSLSQPFILILEDEKRYAHTATCSYQLTLASLQTDERRASKCICSTINEAKLDKAGRSVVIIEHNLNEYIMCILDEEELPQCKLNLVIEAGEQIAFRTIGRTPVKLAGLSERPVSFQS